MMHAINLVLEEGLGDIFKLWLVLVSLRRGLISGAHFLCLVAWRILVDALFRFPATARFAGYLLLVGCRVETTAVAAALINFKRRPVIVAAVPVKLTEIHSVSKISFVLN